MEHQFIQTSFSSSVRTIGGPWSYVAPTRFSCSGWTTITFHGDRMMTEDGPVDYCDEKWGTSMNTVFVSFTSDFPAKRKPFGGRCASCEHNSIYKIATTSGMAKACMGFGHARIRLGDAHVPESAQIDLEAVCSKYFHFKSKTEVIELTGSAGWSTEQ